MNKLESCRWCNSERVSHRGYRIVCNDCGATGPVGDTQADARTLWNTRPTEEKFEEIINQEATTVAKEVLEESLQEIS
jgi:translation initiation factor 2 beta subunit (eIF-2beta)/eIF-5